MVGKINQSFRTFKVVSPNGESLKYHKEFLIMHVIIELGGAQHMGMESNGVDFTIRSNCRENHSNGIVRGVGLDDQQSSSDKMLDNWSRGEHQFQGVKSGLTIIGPGPSDILPSEVGHWSDNVRVSIHEAVVKLRKDCISLTF